MPPAHIPPFDASEKRRLTVLHDYGVVDTPTDPVFDDLTRLAARICGTPIALISLVNEHRQWFMSHHGLSLHETPRSLSFCAHAIRETAPLMIVPDARADARFWDNELVTGEPHFRFYAGSPLRTPEGHALGTLAVIDRQPRELTPSQLEAVQILARQAMSQLELRHAVAKLQQSEERFHSVARAVSDVIWEWDLSRSAQGEKVEMSRAIASRTERVGRLWWSEGFREAFGFKPEDTLETIADWVERIHPDDRTRVVDHLQAAIASKAKGWRDEYRFRRADGSYAIVQDFAEILREADGRARRLCGSLRDLTELRRLEAQALRAQRLEGLGALAGGIAHDLNNVLTPALVSADMLKNQLADRPAEAQLAEMIETAARRGAELVRQILSFARGAKGPHAPTSMRSVLLEAVALAGETFPRSIRIETHLPNDLWLVRGNATHLHQVFVNLLVNARDAMPQGGTLTISAKNEKLPRETCSPFRRQSGAYVTVEVRDTGTGMTPEVLDRAFEPFFTTKPPGSGTGLGLSTVHGIVTSHQGFVRVASEVGTGTTFTVCFPADGISGPAKPAAGTPLRAPRGQGEQILVVDDEETIRFVAKHVLELNGYRVVTASNGQEALSIFSARPDDFHLVLMDLMMPVMDGVTCIGELLKVKPSVRIVIASGGLQPGFSRSLPEGLPFLPKPYVGDALLKIVRENIDAPERRPS